MEENTFEMAFKEALGEVINELVRKAREELNFFDFVSVKLSILLEQYVKTEDSSSKEKLRQDIYRTAKYLTSTFEFLQSLKKE